MIGLVELCFHAAANGNKIGQSARCLQATSLPSTDFKLAGMS